MCGIAGIINFQEEQSLLTGRIKQMCDAIDHRGPDDEGYVLVSGDELKVFRGSDSKINFEYDEIEYAKKKSQMAFGFRRLSIIDLSIGGHQPMISKDNKYILVYNGEIYNYKEIRSELIEKGILFSTKSDSEVVLNSYLYWGEDCVNRFNGMWGFCIYSIDDKTVFASRDRIGVKPFYYYHDEYQFIFSSEIKAILQNKEIERVVDKNILINYLYNGAKDFSDRTFFKNVKQLEPGNNLIIRDNKVEIKQYWDVEVSNKYRDSSALKDCERDFFQILNSSIKLRIQSDVPIGISLSGGLDSSSIAVLLASLITERINSFSTVYQDPKLDEREYARKISDHIESNHKELEPTIDGFRAEIDEFIFHHEEPVRSLSTYAQWCLMRVVKSNNISVLLEGQGADELLGGYLWYTNALLLDHIISLRFRHFISEINEYSKGHGLPIYKIVKSFIAYSYRKLLYPYEYSPVHSLLTSKAKKLIYRYKTQKKGFLCRALQFGIKKQIRELLNYGDKNSMKFSIENRVPFLDYRLVNLVSKYPLIFKINRGVTKFIQREALRKYLPEKIVNRWSKMGFSSPQELWIREELIGEINSIMKSSILTKQPFFRKGELERYLSGFSRGDHSDDGFLWRIYNFEKWYKLYECTEIS